MAKKLDFFAIDKVRPKSPVAKQMLSEYQASIKENGLFAPETNALRQALGQYISASTSWTNE